jgi:chromosome segregation ATPase
LDDGNRKFSQLKEDFKYNLTLLDARDAEIRRLEGCCGELQLELQTLREEKSALAQRVERWQAKDAERREKSKSDSAMHKVGVHTSMCAFSKSARPIELSLTFEQLLLHFGL